MTVFKVFLAAHKNPCNEDKSDHISIHGAMVNSPGRSCFPNTIALLSKTKNTFSPPSLLPLHLIHKQ